jgi:hypothetical protein
MPSEIGKVPPNTRDPTPVRAKKQSPKRQLKREGAPQPPAGARHQRSHLFKLHPTLLLGA